MRTSGKFKIIKWIMGINLVLVILVLPQFSTKLALERISNNSRPHAGIDSVRQTVNRFVVSSGSRNLYIESVDSIPYNINLLRFSRDGENFKDSVIINVNEISQNMNRSMLFYSVLYYTDNDTLYLVMESSSGIISYGEDVFKIEIAYEDPTYDLYKLSDEDVWHVADSTWVSSHQPRLRPKNPCRTLYICHNKLGFRWWLDCRTVFFQSDSNGSLNVYSGL